MSFTSFHLHLDLLRGLEAIGFTVPTPIQTAAIPPAMAGRDLLDCAETGSGKTAAYLLPILHRLTAGRRGITRALILAPTRELAAQIDEHRRDLARYAGIGGAAVNGGVATPGRLLDHFRRPYARLTALEILVLDEADRMLDLGFLPDIRRILGSNHASVPLASLRIRPSGAAGSDPDLTRPAGIPLAWYGVWTESGRHQVDMDRERRSNPDGGIPGSEIRR